MNLTKRSIVMLTLVSGALYAQSTPNADATKVDTITVIEEKEKSVNLEDILKYQPGDIGDILKNESSIDVAGGSPNAKRFYIRGISEALTTISIDGAKQSKDLHQHRGGLSSIDTDILKSVKVNAGVASADQGPGNLGGSVKFETVDAQDLLVGQDRDYGAYVKTTLGSIDDSYKNSLALYGKVHENVGILVYGNKADAQNYNTGSGREVLSSAEEVENYMIKMSMIDLSDHSVRVSYEENTQEGLYQSGGSGSDMGYHDPDGTRELERQRVQRETTILNHSYNPENSYINTKFKVYRNDTTLAYLERDSSSDIVSEGEGLDLRNTFEFSNDSFTNSLTVGFDYENEDGESGDRIVTSENKGIFAQNRMNIDKLSFSFGARYDDFESDLGQKKFAGDEISSNVNVEYEINDKFSVYGGYGEAVSGSNTVPIGWLTGSKTMTFNDSIDGDLEAQKSKKYEVGTNINFGNLFEEKDNLNFKVSLFDTTIQNPIAKNGGGNQPQVDLYNYPDIEARGFEIQTNYFNDNLSASLSYSHSQVKQDGKEIEGTIKRSAGNYGDKIVANVSYDVSDNLNFGYTIIGALENKDATDDVNNKAGYAVSNISTTYTPNEFKNITFNLAVNNLFDKDYAAHTSLTSGGEAVAEPGRDVRVSLKYTF